MNELFLSLLSSIAPALMVIAAAFLVHTYVLYPILMLWLQKRGVRYGPAVCIQPGGPQDDLPTVTVVIAAFNAADHIEAKLHSCLALDYAEDRLSVVVVSDGSTDATDAIVLRFADRHRRVRLMSVPQRQGKAACINDAVPTIDSELLLFTDARQMIDPSAARYLASHFEDQAVGAVSGALEIAKSGKSGVVESAGAYWRLEKKLRGAEASVHSAIGVTGAIYMLRRSVFKPIPQETILDDVLIPMNAVMAGKRVLFDWRALAFDSASDSEEQERARKIRTLAGNFQLMALCPSLLNPLRNPVWIQFMSHKVFRVVAPVALGVFLVANAALAPTNPAWAILLIAQLTVYAITILPETDVSPWNAIIIRLCNTVRGFVRLQWYAVLGFIWYLKNRQPQIWPTTQRRAKATRVRTEPWRNSQLPPGTL